MLLASSSPDAPPLHYCYIGAYLALIRQFNVRSTDTPFFLFSIRGRVTYTKLQARTNERFPYRINLQEHVVWGKSNENSAGYYVSGVEKIERVEASGCRCGC